MNCCPRITRMCGNSWSIQITRGGRLESGIVTILSSVSWDVVQAPDSRRVKSSGKSDKALYGVVADLFVRGEAWFGVIGCALC